MMIMRSIWILLITLAWPLVQGFGISWFRVPASENEVYDERKDAIPAPEIRPDNSWKSQYYPFSLDDQNRVCTMMFCEKKPCCEGLCVRVFETRLCVKLPFAVHRKRK